MNLFVHMLRRLHFAAWGIFALASDDGRPAAVHRGNPGEAGGSDGILSSNLARIKPE
jgi:hypothetical protein